MPISSPLTTSACWSAGGVCSAVQRAAAKHSSMPDVTAWPKVLQENGAQLRSPQQLRRRFDAALLLNQAQEAWQCALVLKSAEAWRALAAHAMHTMDVQLAIR